MTHDIFLSYARSDKAIMQRVRRSMGDDGLSVWTDEGIEPGTANWLRDIEQAITQAKCLVCILTPSAKNSRWVLEELMYAWKFDKKIYMIHAEGEERNVTILGFSLMQMIDIREKHVYEARMRYLIKTIKRNHFDYDDNPRHTIRFANNLLDEVVEETRQETLAETKTQVHVDSSAHMPPDETHQFIVREGKAFTSKTTFDITKPRVTYGRAEKNDIKTSDMTASSEHFEITYTEDGFVLSDLQSTNGTYINQRRLDRKYLADGDVIKAGKVTLQYRTNRPSTP